MQGNEMAVDSAVLVVRANDNSHCSHAPPPPPPSPAETGGKDR